MIGPTRIFTDLIGHFDGDRYTVERSSVAVPSQRDIDAHAEMIGRDIGVRFQEGECLGAYLVVERENKQVAHVARDRFYALARPEDVLEAAAAIVMAIKDLRGPGRAWSLAGRVHVIDHEGSYVAANVNGSMHMCVRAFVAHENGEDRVRHDVAEHAKT